MKSWFTKFRISAALDDGKPLSSSLRHKIACSDELRRFAESSEALDRALKEDPAGSGMPASLHASILRAVRAAGRPAPRRNWTALRWAPASVLAALVLVGVWWGLQRSVQPPAPVSRADSQPLAPALAALDLSEEVARTMPDAILAPLSDEWQRLSHDVDNTAQFLLASLP